MKLLLSVVAAVLLGIPTALAQCNPNPATDLQVTFSPASPAPGQPITIKITNVSASCAYIQSSGCTINSIHQNTCQGQAVWKALICTKNLIIFGPGQSVSHVWNQLDQNGQQVPIGTYAFNTNIKDPNFNPIGLCPTVTIGNGCPLPTPFGSGNPGTGGQVPVLSSFGGGPKLGNAAFGLAINNALGGSQAVLFLGPIPANLQANWGSLYVNPSPPAVILPLPLGGAVGQAGAGSLILPSGIPNNNALIGVTVYAQFLVADPGSSGGISTTQGLTFTICQ